MNASTKQANANGIRMTARRGREDFERVGLRIDRSTAFTLTSFFAPDGYFAGQAYQVFMIPIFLDGNGTLERKRAIILYMRFIAEE